MDKNLSEVAALARVLKSVDAAARTWHVTREKAAKRKGIPIFITSWISRTERLLKEVGDMKAQDMYLDQAYDALKSCLVALERCLGTHLQK